MLAHFKHRIRQDMLLLAKNEQVYETIDLTLTDVIVASVPLNKTVVVPRKRINMATRETNRRQRNIQCLAVIDELCTRLKLSKDIGDQSKVLYRSAIKSLDTKRYQIDLSYSAASLFIVCRRNASPRTIQEICSMVNIPIRRFHKRFLTIKAVCKLGMVQMNHIVQGYLNRIVIDMKLTNQVLACCHEIVGQYSECTALTGKRPTSVAAAIVVFSLWRHGYEAQFERIADLLPIAALTIRQLFVKADLTGQLLKICSCSNGYSVEHMAGLAKMSQTDCRKKRTGKTKRGKKKTVPPLITSN